ncbi:MAG: glycosyltransferase [Nitrososphaeria archaeon]
MKILSLLYSPLAFGAEERGEGWHFRSAVGLRRYGGHTVVCLRPGGTCERKMVKGVPVLVEPMVVSGLGPYKIYLSPSLYARAHAYMRDDYLPYIHEYRAFGSRILIGLLRNHRLVLQHHSSFPPTSRKVKGLRFLRGSEEVFLMKKVRGVIFTLSMAEKCYLENFGLDAKVMVRPMGVDFEELVPAGEEEKRLLRRKWGLPADGVVLYSYAGGRIKGYQNLPYVWKSIKKRFTNVSLVATGVPDEKASEALRDHCIKAYTYTSMTHADILEILKASDLAFLAAPAQLANLGIQVVIMEAMALGKPVVSPTLIHVPDEREIEKLGVMTDFVDDKISLNSFIKGIEYAIENLDRFESTNIRDVAYRYYSWNSFVRDFESALASI